MSASSRPPIWNDNIASLLQSQAVLQAMMSHTPSFTLLIDRDGHIIYINRTFESDRMEDVVGKSIYDWMPETDHSHVREVIGNAFETGEIGTYETSVPLPGASPVQFATYVGPIYKEGVIESVLLIANDVTESRKHEERQKSQHQVLQMMARGEPLATMLEHIVQTIEKQCLGTIGSVLLLDRKAGRLHHCAGPNLPAEYCQLVDGIEIGPQVGSCGTAAFHNEVVAVSDILTDVRWEPFRMIHSRFGLRSCWSHPIRSSDGDVLGTFAVYSQDVRAPSEGDLETLEHTAQLAQLVIEAKRSEERRHEQDQLLRTMADAMPGLFCYVDRQVRYQFNNAGYITWYQATPAELKGRLVKEVIGDAFFAKIKPYIEAAFRGETVSFESELTYPDGVARFVRATYAPKFGPDGQTVDGYFAMVTDISDQKMAERALRQSEQRFRELFESSSDAIFVESLDGHVIDANRAACQLHGISHDDLVGSHVFDLVPKEVRDEVWTAYQQIAAGSVTTAEGYSLHANGRRIPVEIRANRVEYAGQPAVLLHVRDVSARRRAEETLRQRETELAHVSRLTTMGQFTGELAHELNQPLAAISNYASACQTVVNSDSSQLDRDDVAKWTAKLVEQSNRAGDIVRRIMHYVKKHEVQQEPVDINAVVQDVIELLRSTIDRKEIDIQLNLKSELPTIKGDHILLQQVLVNLGSKCDRCDRQRRHRSSSEKDCHIQQQPRYGSYRIICVGYWLRPRRPDARQLVTTI